MNTPNTLRSSAFLSQGSLTLYIASCLER
jgi:hypothetical protein